ncbi:hypothetical protein Pcinc_008511 [Petrolisthes cinctipes]|uniref:MADF domain-containing protein n=1 Tax=Petrolisthes cinctipes TaxID=88211 RepID=A0AAE1KWE0_PETCI|nr:hypothetical protein Pcinc_008511 [Petrolisthes cinctipes]
MTSRTSFLPPGSIVHTTEAADSGLTTFLFIIIINNVCYIRMEYDEPLINLVASCPWTYDTAHEKYKDIVVKRNSWKQIAQQLNMTEEQCRKRWICLRDRYVRMRRVHEKAIPSGSGSDSIPKIKWELYPLLDSLLHHCKEHRTGGNSFQLGSSSQPDSASSSNEDYPDTISPDNNDVLEMFTDWQASLTQWVTAHQPKKTSTCSAVAAADYIRTQLLKFKDPIQQKHVIKKIFDIIHESMDDINHL